MVASARRASFTAIASGKSSATSGSKTTRFVPAAKRAAYLPRIPPRKSYSGSGSSAFTCCFGDRLGRAFFIHPPFAARGGSRADDLNDILALGVHHNQPAARRGKKHERR